LLVVISILGLLAGLAVPAVKSLGKSNIAVSASRQMLDEAARARQLAMSRRATVYLVFIPTNFWGNTTWFNALNVNQRDQMTNLLDKQLTGYSFVSFGAVGDQPGRHQWHYIGQWRNLPEGMYLAADKFAKASNQYYTVTNHVTQDIFNVYGFSTIAIPFPTEDSPTNLLPAIGFNYLGQLSSDGIHMDGRPTYLPLVRGGVSPAIDPSTRQLQLGPASVSESPAGNGTNAAFNIVAIDPLTGRSTLEYQRVQ